ncbi:hypothetical protein AMTRI_Chr04g190240 [Amborella trichopoda]
MLGFLIVYRDAKHLSLFLLLLFSLCLTSNHTSLILCTYGCLRVKATHWDQFNYTFWVSIVIHLDHCTNMSLFLEEIQNNIFPELLLWILCLPYLFFVHL